ncbi:efflux RND transporter periplasmic adaptor subunit [Hymenobacter weizhouensis]|uniref:efflux RND transporter periplasmic adaptor subunit n=1 Tax=Hymenobacter sp. YIM 151500-1 TaxID=2987689 RepID=UPI002228055B|nr:efflux RND transporter periplasmic adaptor subunit [Hymenobacter sp. YIM 151500-1]UYZ65104.1 efflux RND transporter periplasmic adaptor subunit [Hymenobacter sp. YIM 151500-1]
MLLTTAALLTACQSRPEAGASAAPAEAARPAASSPNQVQLTPAQAEAAGLELGSFTWQNVASAVRASGVVDVPPQHRASISAVLGGYVHTVAVLPGQAVRRGGTVAVLRHPDYIKLQQDYLQTKARVTFLQQEQRRQQVLNAEDVGARRKLEQAESELRSETARLRATAAQLRLLGLSLARLDRGTIVPEVPLVSPIGGYVTEVRINPGQYVNPQDVLVEVVNRSDLHLELQVFERDIARVRNGQRILFTLPSRGSAEQLTARVFLVGKAFDAEKRTVSVHAHLEPPGTDVLPGQYVTAQIQTDGTRQRTLPEDALIQAGDISYIFARTSTSPLTFGRYPVRATPTPSGEVAVVPLEPIADTTHLVRRGAYFLDAELRKGQDEEE